MGGVYRFLDDERINARSLFSQGVDAGIDGSWATRVGTVIQSDSEIEDYADLGAVDQMALWEGEPRFAELPNFRGALRNVEYITGLRIQKADIRRDKVGKIAPRVSDLGVRASQHWEKLASDLILAAETDGSATIGGLSDLSSQSYDGQAFFDTDHSFTGATFSASQSNDLAAAAYSSLNTASATAPTPDEASAIVTDLLGHFWTLKDSAGEPANASARNFLIMVGTNQLFSPISSAIGLQTLSAGSQSRAFGAIQTLGLNVELVLNPRLSANTSKVYVFRTDENRSPFILQEEVPVQLVERPDDPFRKHIEVAAWAGRSAGFADWTKALVATLS
jgi:hypothetical protein